MVGGIVIEVVDSTDGRVYVRCRDTRYSDECAIYVQDGPEAQAIELGDSLWWQCGIAYWTPKGDRGIFTGMQDVKLKKVGYSGSTFRPEPRRVGSRTE